MRGLSRKVRTGVAFSWSDFDGSRELCARDHEVGQKVTTSNCGYFNEYILHYEVVLKNGEKFFSEIGEEVIEGGGYVDKY